MSRRGGRSLRKRARQLQWRAFRRRGPAVVAIALCGYVTTIGMGLGVPSLLWAALGTWPPPFVSTPFGGGALVGAIVVGAAWWTREIAQFFAPNAERERKGAEGEESTDQALRRLRRQGWRVVHDIEFPGKGNVDHLLVGPGGIIAIDSKYTTERLWVTPKAIGGSRIGYIGKAAWSATLARKALEAAGHPDVEVEPALMFWGPGAPEIDGGHSVIQKTLVIEGRNAKEWRKALAERPGVLEPSTVRAIAADLERGRLRRRTPGAKANADA